MANDLDPLTAPEPQPTGALVVMFRDGCDGGVARSTIESRVGRRPHCTSEYAGHMRDAPQVLRSEGMLFYHLFGMAIVDPTVCGVEASMIEALRDSDDVVSVRPEYYMHASNWLCRLLGFGKRAPEKQVAAPEPATPARLEPEIGLPTKPAQPGPEREAQTMAGDATWGLRAVGADVSALSGAGVKLAILDTGIDATHPDFAGRTIVAESFAGGTPHDGQGHGTHVAGTAAGAKAPAGVPRYGVAYEAELHVGKVLDDGGSGREGDILAGIVWALEQGCQIVSMSLGRRPLPGDSSGDYERIGRVALAQGSLIIAAAGNDSQRGFGIVAPVGAPANAPSVLAVGAIDEALEIASFSNGGLNAADGGEINICAPGVDVLSSVPGGGHRAFSGTSMATPHVAGLAALLAQSDPGLRGQALWDALQATARDIGLPKQDGGAGLAQAPKGDPGVS